MKIVISDYPDVLGRDLEKEYACLDEVLPEAEIVTHPYTDAEAFFREMQDADGLLTAFIPLDKQALDRMPRLKAISINSTGYNFVDLEETCRRDIPVCAIGEYCTQEVAEHTMAMLLALDRNLRVYARTVDKERRWQYQPRWDCTAARSDCSASAKSGARSRNGPEHSECAYWHRIFTPTRRRRKNWA